MSARTGRVVVRRTAPTSSSMARMVSENVVDECEYSLAVSGLRTHGASSQRGAGETLNRRPRIEFTKLAPVLNVRDLMSERRFYEALGLPVIYEGPEYPDFIAFGTNSVDFGIQKAHTDNDPPSVLTWQIGVSDIDAAIAVCDDHGLDYTVDVQTPRHDWVYRRLLLTSPSGYRVALEGPTET
ncbi:VOC family protein [Actinopolymorpha alba]|uniref:VOC family protein n=1 Tax=Actinopolymorpha alba TaxID=533267 RepID=UPI00039FA0FA|nr:VOC family protein [Actinopolymorpha alba]